MANYPQLDDCQGVWKLKDIKDAVMGGYWRVASARMMASGGSTSGDVDTTDYAVMSSDGNFADFGNLSSARDLLAGMGSHTRAIFGGGQSPGKVNTIEFFTLATTGNASDFGDLTSARGQGGAVSNSIRGLPHAGAESPDLNTIDYVSIASTGNATDYGDLTVARSVDACGSPTRGIFAGGYPNTNVIDFVTLATTGNAIDFGDLLRGDCYLFPASSSTRATFSGGQTPSPQTDIQLVTIASQGNTIDYGDLSGTSNLGAGTSNSVLGFAMGGTASDSTTNAVDKFTIAIGGTATDFGNLTQARTNGVAGHSGSHGGLNDGTGI